MGIWWWIPRVQTCGFEELHSGNWYWCPQINQEQCPVLVDMGPVLYVRENNRSDELFVPQGNLSYPSLQLHPTLFVNSPRPDVGVTSSFALFPQVQPGFAFRQVMVSLPLPPPHRLCMGAWYALPDPSSQPLSGQWHWGEFPKDPSVSAICGWYFICTKAQGNYYWYWLPRPPIGPESQLRFATYLLFVPITMQSLSMNTECPAVTAKEEETSSTQQNEFSVPKAP